MYKLAVESVFMFRLMSAQYISMNYIMQEIWVDKGQTCCVIPVMGCVSSLSCHILNYSILLWKEDQRHGIQPSEADAGFWGKSRDRTSTGLLCRLRSRRWPSSMANLQWHTQGSRRPQIGVSLTSYFFFLDHFRFTGKLSGKYRVPIDLLSSISPIINMCVSVVHLVSQN